MAVQEVFCVVFAFFTRIRTENMCLTIQIHIDILIFLDLVPSDDLDFKRSYLSLGGHLEVSWISFYGVSSGLLQFDTVLCPANPVMTLKIRPLTCLVTCGINIFHDEILIYILKFHARGYQMPFGDQESGPVPTESTRAEVPPPPSSAVRVRKYPIGARIKGPLTLHADWPLSVSCASVWKDDIS